MSATIFEQSVLPLYEATRTEWLQQARAAAYAIGSDGCAITINDVRRVCPPPVDVDPRIMGAVFLRKYWQKIGYLNSNRNQCHGRPVAIYELK